MLKDSIIQQIAVGLYNDSSNATEQNRRCFRNVPTFCSPSLTLHAYCKDILEKLACSDQAIDLTINLTNYQPAQNVHFLGNISSPAVFSKVTIIGQHDEICMNASKLNAKFYYFVRTVPCNISLLSIQDTVREIHLIDWNYTFIPTVFLQFDKLYYLALYSISEDKPVLNCSCALANAFYAFLLKVPMNANCSNGDDAQTWILENYRSFISFQKNLCNFRE